jgi:hypothetical protein
MSEFLGVRVGGEKKVFSGVGVEIEVKEVDSAGQY